MPGDREATGDCRQHVTGDDAVEIGVAEASDDYRGCTGAIAAGLWRIAVLLHIAGRCRRPLRRDRKNEQLGADDHGADLELADEPAAVPAR